MLTEKRSGKYGGNGEIIKAAAHGLSTSEKVLISMHVPLAVAVLIFIAMMIFGPSSAS